MKANLTLLSLALVCTAVTCYADQPIIINNNNNNAQPPQQNNNCNDNQSSNNGQKPGTYYQSNPRGGTDTVYTTGDKQPYIVDNNCNNTNTPIIQPYVYTNPPGPGPGPRPVR